MAPLRLSPTDDEIYENTEASFPVLPIKQYFLF